MKLAQSPGLFGLGFRVWGSASQVRAFIPRGAVSSLRGNPTRPLGPLTLGNFTFRKKYQPNASTPSQHRTDASIVDHHTRSHAGVSFGQQTYCILQCEIDELPGFITRLHIHCNIDHHTSEHMLAFLSLARPQKNRDNKSYILASSICQGWVHPPISRAT